MIELSSRQGYSLGVAGIVLRDGEVLLVRRAYQPNRGKLTFPSGYVEANERVDHAAVREVTEETGVSVEVVALVGVRNRVSRYDNNLVLFFLMRHLAGEPRADGVEVDEAVFLPVEEALQRDDFLELNRKALERAIGLGDKGARPTDCPPTPGIAALDYIAFL